MRHSISILLALIVCTSCFGEPRKHARLVGTLDAATGPRGGDKDAAVDLAGAGGSGGGMVTGGADGGTATEPDAGQTTIGMPDGGCGSASKTCVGNVLTVCDGNGALSTTECVNGCDPVRGCNACKPNSRSCSGTNLVVCKSDGSGTETMTCASGCNVSTGECFGCVPSTTWCNGDVLRQCNAAGEASDRQACEFGCSEIQKACNACRPGSRTCRGQTLESCKPDGTEVTMESCARGCAGGACCVGNTEARGGTCAACGGNNQPCCEISSPQCAGGLVCLNGRCALGCGGADGQCPSGCGAGQDPDCRRPDGGNCASNLECRSGFCAPGGRCCNRACTDPCEECGTGQCRARSCDANRTCINGECVLMCSQSQVKCGDRCEERVVEKRQTININCDPATFLTCEPPHRFLLDPSPCPRQVSGSLVLTRMTNDSDVTCIEVEMRATLNGNTVGQQTIQRSGDGPDPTPFSFQFGTLPSGAPSGGSHSAALGIVRSLCPPAGDPSEVRNWRGDLTVKYGAFAQP
jgi:hypothetical protein